MLAVKELRLIPKTEIAADHPQIGDPGDKIRAIKNKNLGTGRRKFCLTRIQYANTLTTKINNACWEDPPNNFLTTFD